MDRLSKRAFIAIAVTIAFVYFSQCFSALDLALYDFNFLLKKQEPIDERIVIVEWDESSIQMLDETTVSDDVLVALLEKLGNKPRIIGLDLYRDVPVFSPRISDEANLKAYKALQRIFAKTTNLVGIEKVIEPSIAPPSVLKERGLVAASDIPSDRDNAIRRAYINPQENAEGEPAGLPYLGTVLGYQYLAKEGWTASVGKNFALVLSKGKRSIDIEPIKNFAGIPPADPYGSNFLINWRKGQAVEKISIIDVVSGRFDPNLFEDKIVLIGNVSTSTADKHYLPIKRWADENLTCGVEIVAQVASSIISAAIERRNLLNPTPLILNLLILVIVSLGTILLVLRYSLVGQHRPSASIVFFQSLRWVIIASLCLILLNIILFFYGWWMPIANILFAAWFSCLTICYRYYFKKHTENERRLLLSLKDVQHSLGTPLGSLKSSNEKIEQFISILENKYGSSKETNIIHRKTNNIYRNIERLEKYKKRSEDYIYTSYTDKDSKVSLSSVDINNFAIAIARRCIESANTKSKIDLHTELDSSLVKAKVNVNVLEIVLENLLDNAVYAVAKKDNPIISIKTHLYQKKKKIEFCITNNGPKIPKSIQNKIFEPFISYSNSQGIGLYLVSEFLHLSNGKISVTSTEQETTFVFILPYDKNKNSF